MYTLNNQELEAPVYCIYPGMSLIHKSYKEVINKVCNLYKTWKNRTLTEASKIFEEIIIPEYTNLMNATKLRHLGDILMNHFHPQWLPQVFLWANEAVSLVECKDRSMQWLKCMLTATPYPYNTNL